jgi:hypothetical protein
MIVQPENLTPTLPLLAKRALLGRFLHMLVKIIVIVVRSATSRILLDQHNANNAKLERFKI